MLGITVRSRLGFTNVIAVVAAFALLSIFAAKPADALLRTLTKTTTTVVKTTTSTTNTLLQPVTQVTEPVTSTVTTTVVEPVATTGGTLVGDTTTALAGTVDTVLEPLPDTTADALNPIPAGYDPIAPLAALLGGSAGFPSTLEQLACPPVQEAGELLSLTGAGTIGDGLTSLACSAGLLEYRFYTRFRDADGTIVAREHVATLGLPTALDVDRDIEPDLIGTITLTGLNSVGLVVERFATETSPLPVSVEAVLRDPSGASLGRERIAFGYDARHDVAPRQFVLSTAIDTILQPKPDFTINLAQAGPGAKIAVLGSIFDGPLDARVNPAEVRLDYGRSPAQATIRARIGGDESLVELTTPSLGPASISGRIVDATEEQRFGVNIADLPQTFALSATQHDGTSTASLSGSAAIARLDGSFERLRNIGPEPLIAQKAMLDLTDVPLAVDLSLSGDSGSVTTTGGPIGHTRVGVANGEPVFLIGKPAYVNVHEAGPLRSVAVAVPGLRNASFTLGDAPQVSAEMSPTPFLVRVTQPGRTLGADILDLPARFDLGMDLAEGRITYDGHGDGIARIVLSGDGVEPLFARATKLRGTIEGIPSQMTTALSMGADGGEFTVDGGAIGRVELLASNGAEELPAGTDQGFVYRDVTGGQYVVSARILGLRRVALASTETLSLQTHTAGGPFTLVAQTDGFTANGRIADLPAKSALTAALDQGRLTFQGRTEDDQPAGIETVDFDVSSAEPLLGRADHLDAHVAGIPADLALELAQTGDGMDLTASEPVRLVELVARNGAIADPQIDLPAGGEQGAKLVDITGGEFAVGARLKELSRFAGSFGDAMSISAHTAGGPFGLQVLNDELDGMARIEDLPAKIDLGLDTVAGRLTVQGRDAQDQPQGIERIRVDLDGSTPLFGRATDVHGYIEDVPADVTLDLAQTGTGLSLRADNPIGLIEIAADSADIADPLALLPADGEQGAVYRDTADRFLVSARLRQLQQLDASLTDSIGLRALTAGGPFSLLVETAGVTADAHLRDLPADVEATFDLAEGAFSYRGKDAAGNPQGVDLVTVDVTGADPIFGRATDLSARFEQLADTVNLQLSSGGTGGPTARVEASTPIRRVEVLATDGGGAFPAPLDDPTVQGAVLRDRTGEPYVAALRLLDLRKLALTFGSELGVEAITAGGPFFADVATDDFDVAASILDLPANATLALDVASGEIRFAGLDAQGAPAGVELLTIDGRLASSFLGRAERLSARIEKLPATVAVGFSQADGRASLSASEPVQLIELFAWQNGQPKPVMAADQGAILHDRTGEPFELAARIRQLEQLDIDFSESMQLTTKTAGGLFDADIRTDALDARAIIDELPTELTLGLDTGTGNVVYTGSSPIDRIFASIRSTDPVFLGATAFEVELQQVPQAFQLGLGTESENIRLTADNPIGQIDVRAKSPGREYPQVPAGEAGAILDSAGDELALALRVFELEKLDVNLSPMTLEAEMQGGRKFLVDANVESVDETTGTPSTLQLDGVIDALPSRVKLALEDVVTPAGAPNGSRLVLDGSAPIGFVRLAVRGVELLPGADRVEAEINDLPQSVTVALPETGSLARVEARNASGVATAIGQLRLAASNGTKALPAFVSDAQYNSSPNTVGYRDRLEFDNSPSSFAVALRLTAAKVIDVNLDPIALTLEQDGARTRPIAIAASVPNSTAGQPATTVSGLLNKPSSRTVLGVDILPNQPTRLRFENAAPVGSLSLNAANLGSIPTANFSLANIPTRLSVCLHASSQCRPTASNRIPAALSDYSGAFRSPTQSATAGGQNRPYAALVSMNFEDFGTSGTSSAISSMVTLNASIKLSASAAPITITNLRFHNLALDLGDHPTNKSFSYLGSSVPRIYMFLDSLNQPFVMNEIKYPPTIESFKIGTDSSPASGNRRLVWLPGTRCSASFGSTCFVTVLDSRTSGSLNCGGQRALTVRLLGININLLDFLGIQILPVCS